MAGGATGYVLRRPQVIFLPQCFTQLKLAGIRFSVDLHRVFTAWLLIMHVENLLPRTQEFFRLAMAVQAPFHLQGVFLVHERHRIHLAVTAVTAHALVDVDTVIEVNKIGEIMHARPLQGLAAGEAEADRSEHGRICPYLRVTVHTSLGGRDSGKARLLHRRMAIPAIQAEAGSVMLMAERNRLFRRNMLRGDVRGTLQL